jgi:hypothetical protein
MQVEAITRMGGLGLSRLISQRVIPVVVASPKCKSSVIFPRWLFSSYSGLEANYLLASVIEPSYKDLLRKFSEWETHTMERGGLWFPLTFAFPVS